MDWDSSVVEGGVSVDPVRAVQAQQAFMTRVYGWMFAGLALTGVVALFTASSRAMLEVVLPLRLPLMLGELGLVMALSWLGPRLSSAAAAVMFVAYAALNGLTFSVIFLVYRLGSVASAFFITAGAFGAMSLYARITRKDLSAWGSFLMMGLFGVLIAGVVQMIWPSEGLSFVWSCCSVVVFAGLTAYDTQKLRLLGFAAAYEGESAAGRLAVQGALTLYLDFVNLFLALLRLFGRRR